MDRPRVSRTTPLPYPRVLIAPDKFKGTLSAESAARAIEQGIRRAWPKVRTTCLALTDGGEGFVELMVRETGGRLLTTRTVDAAWRPCQATWGTLEKGRVAVIGLSNASGISRLPLRLRNPERTSNLGTGLLVTEALRKGFREILVGLGGSATHDGGISLASALGYRFLDKLGRDIALDGRGLGRLEQIAAPKNLPKAQFVVATDVMNPLYGPKGAARQFAAQKGANPAMVERLEKATRRLARIVQRDLGLDLAKEPGAGSAGGCGYGLMTFFRARRENGFQLIRRILKLDALIGEHDLVITGEGCFDEGSLLGKAPAQLGELARKLDRPAWALCGRIGLNAQQVPFERMAALIEADQPDIPVDFLPPEEHVRRLEKLAFDLASRAA